jgi:hypothetical protein
MKWIVSLFKNPGTTLAVIFGGLASALAIWVQSLRLDSEKVKRDLAEGEAKAVRKATKAQNDAKKETTSELIELEERRKGGLFRDID